MTLADFQTQFNLASKRPNVEVTTGFGGEIRITHNGKVFCPLTFINFLNNGIFRDMTDIVTAGQELGLTPEDTILVSSSSDGVSRDRSFRKSLRDDMLRSVNRPTVP